MVDRKHSRLAGEDVASHSMACQIREMKEPDLEVVTSIESQVYRFPWTEGIFRDCMRAGYYCYVSEQQGEVMGYGIISVGAGESHVLNLCICPGSQRQGYGSTMLKFLMKQARHEGARCILLEVRASNSSAIELYHKMGFNEVGVRNDYYPAPGGREDALVFACDFI